MTDSPTHLPPNPGPGTASWAAALTKPNVNAWVNRLIEEALGPRKADWHEHFDRPSSGRTFRLTGKVERYGR